MVFMSGYYYANWCGKWYFWYKNRCFMCGNWLENECLPLSLCVIYGV